MPAATKGKGKGKRRAADGDDMAPEESEDEDDADEENRRVRSRGRALPETCDTRAVFAPLDMSVLLYAQRVERKAFPGRQRKNQIDPRRRLTDLPSPPPPATVVVTCFLRGGSFQSEGPRVLPASMEDMSIQEAPLLPRVFFSLYEVLFYLPSSFSRQAADIQGWTEAMGFFCWGRFSFVVVAAQILTRVRQNEKSGDVQYH